MGKWTNLKQNSNIKRWNNKKNLKDIKWQQELNGGSWAVEKMMLHRLHKLSFEFKPRRFE